MTNTMVSSLPPREQLDRYGASSLSDEQLMSVILRSGTRAYPVQQVAQHVLGVFPGFKDLDQATTEQLTTIDGVGIVKAMELQAICELGKRIQAQRTVRFGAVASSRMIGELMISKLAGTAQEQLLGVFLDVKNQIIRTKRIYVGTLNSSVAHPREIFNHAVTYSAAQFILVHNHPSGQLEPSTQDLEFTRRIVKCGQMMGIACLDHLIIGADAYLSLREEGYMV